MQLHEGLLKFFLVTKLGVISCCDMLEFAKLSDNNSKGKELKNFFTENNNDFKIIFCLQIWKVSCRNSWKSLTKCGKYCKRGVIKIPANDKMKVTDATSKIASNTVLIINLLTIVRFPIIIRKSSI